LGWWEWTVFLLHTATEIEHALLVQYLYGAYSLADSRFTGHAVPPHAAAPTRSWRQLIMQVVRGAVDWIPFAVVGRRSESRTLAGSENTSMSASNRIPTRLIGIPPRSPTRG
jgi:hypothetical protein